VDRKPEAGRQENVEARRIRGKLIKTQPCPLP